MYHLILNVRIFHLCITEGENKPISHSKERIVINYLVRRLEYNVNLCRNKPTFAPKVCMMKTLE